MATYNVENQWGGSKAQWNKGGVFVLGARDDKPQNMVAIDIKSGDGGKTFTGTMTYEGEGPIGFKASLIGNNNYTVENQWGGNTAPWHPGGTFVIGYRENQLVVAVDIESSDGGKSFTGTMTYAGEGPIGFKAEEIANDNAYHTQNQWGGNTAPWHEGGVFVLGGRSNQPMVAIDVTSPDQGKTLTGTMTYAGEGPIGFRGTLNGAGNYAVENQWGGDKAPWHDGGNWLIGFRSDKQNVVALKATSQDMGKTLIGTLTYAGEGPIGLTANCLGVPRMQERAIA